MLKLSFKVRPHICNFHLDKKSILATWYVNPAHIGKEETCRICGRVKFYKVCGQTIVNNFKPKKYKDENLEDNKSAC